MTPIAKLFIRAFLAQPVALPSPVMPDQASPEVRVADPLALSTALIECRSLARELDAELTRRSEHLVSCSESYQAARAELDRYRARTRMIVDQAVEAHETDVARLRTQVVLFTVGGVVVGAGVGALVALIAR